MEPALCLPVVDTPTTSVVHQTLRIGLVACYIGHGALGLFGVAAWTSYFAVVGIDSHHAFALMPLVGAFDVAMAVSVLFRPVRAVVLYMFGWCLWTALLRPLAGEPGWETIERAGNYGVPLAFFFLMSGDGAKSWLRGSFHSVLDTARNCRVRLTLHLTTVLALLGHGALGLSVQKHLFVTHYASIGLANPAALVPWVGGFECLLALAVLLKPTRSLLLGVVAWKLATEALSPIAGSPIWVFIEHGGSYAAPLALAFLTPRRTRSEPQETEPLPDLELAS